jgi:DNA (cytosine-5)-methyltransferase 1
MPAVAFQLNGDRDDPGVSVSDTAFTLPARPMSDRGQAVAFDARQSDVIQYGDKSGPLDTDGHTIAVAFTDIGQGQRVRTETEPSETLRATKRGPYSDYYQSGMQVRRLTPLECERLQGFPDQYTLIPYRGKAAADGPRYKALGNSMAVPVMAWIGKRIAMVEAISAKEGAA